MAIGGDYVAAYDEETHVTPDAALDELAEVASS
jgi:hypothetical protein